MQRLTLGLAAAVFAVTGMVTLALPVQAASLNDGQIQSIVMLLQSFGVNSTTVINVRNVLMGNPAVATTGAAGPTTVATSSASTSASSAGIVCPSFSEDLYRGRSNKHLHGDEVSVLQRFLSTAPSSDYSAGVTGYFGPETEASVKAWQAAHGVPATGFVGPMTRAAIAHACNPSHRDDQVPSTHGTSANENRVGVSAQPASGTAPLTVAFSLSGASSTAKYVLTYGDGNVSAPFAGSNAPTHAYAKPGDYTATLSPYVACMYNTPRCMIAVLMLGQAHVHVTATSSASATTSTPSIVSVQPATGAVGTQVIIGGEGFTNSNTVFFGGNVAAKNVPAQPAIFHCPMIPAGSTTTTCGSYAQTLTFTVPDHVGPYCPEGSVCPLYVLSVKPGAYALSVQNANGTSATSTFTVATSTSQE